MLIAVNKLKDNVIGRDIWNKSGDCYRSEKILILKRITDWTPVFIDA
jgi:hypothetical protein